MVNSFGGFSGNPDIEAFVNSISTDFVNMVVSNSVILESYQRRPNDVINIAIRQVYPRIGLRLAAAKNLDNSPLFATLAFAQSQLASPGNDGLRHTLYENIIRLMTDVSSPYSEGITNVAASLTAAILIKSIPINTDIKNIDLGENIEKRAFEDLDRIVELYKGNELNVAASTINTETTLQQSIYISLDIDKTTLPANWFNVGNVDERIVIEQAYPSANVKILESLTISSDKIAFGYYFISGTEFESVSSTDTGFLNPELTIFPPLEDTFTIKSGDTSEDIITNLADSLNDAGLTRDTNIIAAPNLGTLLSTSISTFKQKLYSNEVDKTYDRKPATFKLQPRIDYLSFSPRRVSSVINRELIILKFYTLDKVSLATTKLSQLNIPSFTYIGTWDNSTNYSIGNIVDYNSRSYVCKQDSLDNVPNSSADYWELLFSPHENLSTYRNISQDYVEGLLYGLENDFTKLDKLGPKSLLLDVKEGTLKTIGGRESSAASNSLINTFYFKLEEGFTSVTGLLKLRCASTKLTDVPEIFSFLNSTDKTLDINLVNATAEDVALEVLKAVYTISQYTDVLSALVYPHALEFTAFKRTKEEVKEVIDILQIPEGLEIATGTSLIERTPYKPKPRSLIVDAVLIPTSLRRHPTIDGGNSNGKLGAEKVNFTPNSTIQAIKDKISFTQQKGIGYWYVR